MVGGLEAGEQAEQDGGHAAGYGRDDGFDEDLAPCVPLPSVRRMAISARRSVTFASMMFVVVIPPTIGEMLPTAPSGRVKMLIWAIGHALMIAFGVAATRNRRCPARSAPSSRRSIRAPGTSQPRAFTLSRTRCSTSSSRDKIRPPIPRLSPIDPKAIGNELTISINQPAMPIMPTCCRTYSRRRASDRPAGRRLA